ncbi:hypothetical protein [Coprobacter tertius]|uniref:Lipoprotein n=1 Tax=Coprobacter tertius TaxID=2944915 RepID=A0ABT1MHZ6_9BACT|nr:hypothetical protein [Coprobacter tertius]MCP9612247.1 hypothetical protein [Coprobacter tertius]
MKMNLLKNLFVITFTTVTITSCSLGGKDLAMASDEGMEKIKELVKTNINTEECKIYSLEWSEDSKDHKLENILSEINVRYIDKDNNDYDLTINYTDGKFMPEEPQKRKSINYSYQYTTPLDLNLLNAEEIIKKTSAGVELVAAQEDGGQYEFKSIEKYRFYITPVLKKYEQHWKNWSDERKRDYHIVQQSFELNFVRKDEHPEVKGRKVWTNYYTVPFAMNEKGNVEIK